MQLRLSSDTRATLQQNQRYDFVTFRQCPITSLTGFLFISAWNRIAKWRYNTCSCIVQWRSYYFHLDDKSKWKYNFTSLLPSLPSDELKLLNRFLTSRFILCEPHALAHHPGCFPQWTQWFLWIPAIQDPKGNAGPWVDRIRQHLIVGLGFTLSCYSLKIGVDFHNPSVVTVNMLTRH